MRVRTLLLLLASSSLLAGNVFCQEATTTDQPGSDASAFDADAFFSGGSTNAASSKDDAAVEGSPLESPSGAGGAAGEVQELPVSDPFREDYQGLRLTGESGLALSYVLVDPFDSNDAVSRTGTYAGGSYVRLDGKGGIKDAASVDLSLVAGYVYSGSGDPSLSLAVNKLYLSVFTDRFDFYAGRLVVNYGRGTIFSPADLFSEVDTTDLDLGRTGSDVVRLVLPLGPLSGLDLVTSIDKAPENATAGLRAYGNLSGWDFAGAVFYQGESDNEGDKSAVFSLDCKGDALFGVSAEAVAYLPFDDPASISGEAMVGLDYSFGGELFLDAEYQWNGTGGSRGQFQGEHSLFASISFTPDEITALDARVIANLSDTAFLASLAASRNIARGTTLAVFALYALGDYTSTLDSAYLAVADAGSVSLGLNLTVAF